MSAQSTIGNPKRLQSLSDLDFNYNELYPEFKTLMNMASVVSGTLVTQLNLLDSITQWTVATNDSSTSSISVDECVCRYAVESGENLEIKDLALDPRFAEKSYVSGAPHWKYYYGIPLEIEKGSFVGTLCVLDKVERTLNAEQVEMLQLISEEVRQKLILIKENRSLVNQNADLIAKQKQQLSDIRNPLSGIIGITELVIDEPEAHLPAELIEINRLIHDNSRYILSITNEVLDNPENPIPEEAVFTLETVAESLSQLFEPQARTKGVEVNFEIDTQRARIPFSKRKVLQIIGMPLSHAISMNEGGGKIIVRLDMIVRVEGNLLTANITGNTGPSKLKGTEDPGILLTRKYVSEIDGTFEAEEQESGVSYRISLPSFPEVN